MTNDLPEIARASRCAVVHALRALERKGCNGEAARAFMMFDRWLDLVRVLFCENPSVLKNNRALKIVRHGSKWLQIQILETEIRTRGYSV